MAEVVLFHHAQGLTDGVRAFADDLRGHTVHTPDLYDGKTFPALPEGLAYLGTLGFEEIVRRGMAAAVDGAVYIGISLGALPAQALAENHPSARGAVLLHAFIPPLDKVRPGAHDGGRPRGRRRLRSRPGRWTTASCSSTTGGAPVHRPHRCPTTTRRRRGSPPSGCSLPRTCVTRRPRAGRRGR